jgi:hypothetical protein
MKTGRALIVAVIVPLMVMTILAAGAVLAAGGPMPKETVCHFAQNKYVEISVSGNALPAHLRHGDVTPDEYGDCP